MAERDGSKDDARSKGGVSRRTFMATVGAGAVVTATSRGAHGEDEKAPVVEAGELVRVTLDVNGVKRTLLVEPRWSLLFVLRERLGLTGSKEGCSRGECGACTVLIDSVPRYACLTLAVEAQHRKIETVEGLLDGEELGPVQQAFVEEDAFQCGYCTSGQVMAVEGLLRKNDAPDRDTIRTATSGNLCRCGAYPHIANAAERAAELRKGGR